MVSPLAPSLADLRRLACPVCLRAHDLLVLLDRAAHALRGTRWVQVHCPACDAPAHLELASGDASIGRVLADPRRRFEPSMRVSQPGLEVHPAPDGLEVALLHRRWLLAAVD